jgi:hypothetical protein
MTRTLNKKRTRTILALAATVSIPASLFIGAGSADAAVLPVTKKCTTTLAGKALPWYEVDSMFVTRSYVSGKWQYRVERTPNHTSTLKLASGSYRYYDHHIDTIQMYETYYAGKTVNYPGNVTYFTSSYSGMNFYMKAHVQDAPYVNIFPTCRIYF